MNEVATSWNNQQGYETRDIPLKIIFIPDEFEDKRWDKIRQDIDMQLIDMELKSPQYPPRNYTWHEGFIIGKAEVIDMMAE